LFRYVDEQVFRYNNRAARDNPLTDADRFQYPLSQIVEKRLTFAEVTGKVGKTASNPLRGKRGRKKIFRLQASTLASLAQDEL